MEAIGDEERTQAAGTDTGGLSSFHPEALPPKVTQCDLDQNCERRQDAQKFLPCHYFDLICGSSTGRSV